MPISTNPQIKLLEKVYRNSKSASPSALNKARGIKSSLPQQPTVPNGKFPRKPPSKTSRPKKRPPKIQTVKNKARKRGQGRGRSARGRSHSIKSKPSRAVNISKFNGGVKAKQASVLNTAAKVATTTGTAKLSLGAVLANSRFLAGILSFAINYEL